jgi:hypothetical protein
MSRQISENLKSNFRFSEIQRGFMDNLTIEI